MQGEVGSYSTKYLLLRDSSPTNYLTSTTSPMFSELTAGDYKPFHIYTYSLDTL